MTRDLFPPPPEIEPDRQGSSFRDDVARARRADAPDPERDAFLASPEGARILRRLRLSTHTRARRRRLTAFAAVACAVAAVFLGIVFFPRGLVEDPSPPGGGIRLKGNATFLVFSKRGETVTPVADGAVLRPGDRLRFVYRSPYPYLAVVDLEERGGIVPFYPHPAGESLRVTVGERQELPGSIELDESLGTERIIAVFSEAPLSFAQLKEAVDAAYPVRQGRRALGAAAPLELPSAETFSLRIEKRR